MTATGTGAQRMAEALRRRQPALCRCTCICGAPLPSWNSGVWIGSRCPRETTQVETDPGVQDQTRPCWENSVLWIITCLLCYVCSKKFHAQYTLNGLSHQIFKAFFITYDIKSVLSVWTLMVLIFFYSGFLLMFKY
jgi:hypothetical protein